MITIQKDVYFLEDNKLRLSFNFLLTFYPIYPTPQLGRDMTLGQFFEAEFNGIEVRVFPLLE